MIARSASVRPGRQLRSVADKDLEYGARVIRRILRDLEKPENLAHSYAEAVLRQAVQNAASRPTPQARMAAENMTVTGADIHPSAGGPPAEVAVGSEFGSGQYLQFQKPHNPRGYWLFPAGESEAVRRVGDKALEAELQKAVRSG